MEPGPPPPSDDDVGAGRKHEDTWQPRLYVRLVVLLVLAAYAIAFVLSNGGDVTIDFVFASASVSLIWLILLSLALGFVLGILLSQLYRRRRLRRAAK